MNVDRQITIDANRLSLDQALALRTPEISPLEVADLINRFTKGVSELLQNRYEQRELRVTKDKIRRVLRCERNLVESQRSKDKPTPAMVVGTLLDACFSIHASGGEIEDPSEDALSFISTLGEVLEIDHEVKDQVRAKVEEGYLKLAAFWDTKATSERFSLRLQDRIAISFDNGRLQLIGRPDLVLSDLDPNHQTVIVIDVKSGTPKYFDVEDAHLYALMETLRSRRPPSLIGNYYLALDRLDLITTSLKLLDDEAKRTLAAIAKMIEIAQAKSATPTRSVELCQFCPVNSTCEEVTDDDRLGWTPIEAPISNDSEIQAPIEDKASVDD